MSKHSLICCLENGIHNSGRAFDDIFVERLWRSVKHEDVYLKGYATMGELTLTGSRCEFRQPIRSF